MSVNKEGPVGDPLFITVILVGLELISSVLRRFNPKTHLLRALGKNIDWGVRLEVEVVDEN